MSVRRLRVAVVMCVAAGLLSTTAPAAARPILEEADATELANRLAEAGAEHGICYGWEVTVQDDDGSLTGVDRGSSTGGPGAPARGARCPRYVIFAALIHYTSSSSEASDTASFEIESNLPGAPTSDDMRRIGVNGGALLGDRDDVAIINATAALPALVAEKGLAPPVGLEATTGPIPAADRPTGTPGSDRLRTHGALYGFVAVLLLGGLGWIAFALFARYTHPSLPSD